MSPFPSEWLDHYVIKSYHHIDPIVKENFNNFTLQYWADTYKKYTPPKDFVMTAEDFGLKKGYSYGLKNYKGTEGSLFSFSGDFIESNLRTEIILTHITPHLHQAFIRVLGQHKTNDDISIISLTSKEKEVLKWLKEGKNTWDISQILAASQNTVKYHIKNIFLKLDVSNRSHAVARAVELELIGIE